MQTYATPKRRVSRHGARGWRSEARSPRPRLMHTAHSQRVARPGPTGNTTMADLPAARRSAARGATAGRSLNALSEYFCRSPTPLYPTPLCVCHPRTSRHAQATLQSLHELLTRLTTGEEHVYVVVICNHIDSHSYTLLIILVLARRTTGEERSPPSPPGRPHTSIAPHYNSILV